MRWLFVVAVLAACTKKDSSQGLPAAENWNAEQAGSVEKPVTPKGANPHGSGFHGSTDPNAAPADPNDPHAGLGIDPANPGMDPNADPNGSPMGGNNPHQGGNPGPVVEKTAPKVLDKLPDGHYGLGPFAIALPDGWAQKPVTSSMRTADFTFGDGEMIVYYFGTNGAGSIDDNLDRWLGQIRQADGKPSRDVAKIEKTKLGGLDATIMTVTGHYADGGMMGSAPLDIPDAEMLAAIIASPEGPYYFKGFGPKKTLEANAAKFRAMLSSMKVR